MYIWIGKTTVCDFAMRSDSRSHYVNIATTFRDPGNGGIKMVLIAKSLVEAYCLLCHVIIHSINAHMAQCIVCVNKLCGY